MACKFTCGWIVWRRCASHRWGPRSAFSRSSDSFEGQGLTISFFTRERALSLTSMAPALWTFSLALCLSLPQAILAASGLQMFPLAEQTGRSLLQSNECLSRGLQGTCNGCTVSHDHARCLRCCLCRVTAAAAHRHRGSRSTACPLARAVLLLQRRCRHSHVPAQRHLHVCQEGGLLSNLGHRGAQVGLHLAELQLTAMLAAQHVFCHPAV